MFKSLLSTATWKQSQTTIAGTIANGVLGVFFYILLARFLGPSDFGLLVVSVVTLTLISDIVDFGTNTGLVRFASANLSTDQQKAFKFLKLSLEIKLLVSLIVFLIGFLLAPTVANVIFNKSSLTLALRLVMLGVSGSLLFSFATSVLQSFQKYLIWALVNIVTNFLRLVFIVILFLWGELNLTSGLLTYILLPFFGFSISLLILPAKKILSVKNEISVARQFFNFNVWIAIFTIIAAISSRLDIFLNARLLTASEVGIYGAANQLTQVVPQIVSALGIVAAPKFASFQKKEQMIAYFKKLQLLVLGLALLISLAIPASVYFLPLIYGNDYQAAIYPFMVLLLAMIIFLISVPVHSSIIYYYGKPQVFVWVAAGHLLIIAVLGYWLISKYGVIGSAATVAVGMFFNFSAPLIWFLTQARK